MKTKRLFASFLSLALALPLSMTGCQKQADNIDDQSSIRQNVTLNMYILTEKETDPEQAKAVQMAINEILLPNYKTTMKINYLTEDEYWDTIDKAEADTIAYEEQLAAEAAAAKAAAKEANLNKNKKDQKDEADAEDTKTEEQVDQEFNNLIDDVFESDDIVLDHPQIDIFVVNSPEKYASLVNDGRLAALDQYITLENKTLTSYVYPTFFTGAKLSTTQIYGVPVNKPIGEYEYFVFNTELLNKYGYSADDMKTFDSLEGYLSVISANEPGVVPLAHAEEPQFFEYYETEGGAMGIGSDLVLRSTFSDGYAEEVKDHFATIRRYRTAGYLPAEYVDGTPFAVDIRRGCGYSPEKWSREEGTDYTCTVYKRPMAKNGNTLDSIFVVSAQSKNPSRAAEIISLFNTNAELENLLQFGIEGTHYYLNSETGKIRVNPNGGYVMNNNYTGNFYLKYDLDGEENHLEAYKQQTLDSLVSFYYGFVPELTLQDELTLEEANRIALEYYPGLLRGDYDVDATFAQINARLSAIDVSSEISAMLRENPALENERFIYSYDEKKNADDTEEEDPVDETPDDTAAEGDAAEGDAVETVDREISVEEGNGAFERTVKSIDDLLYKFTSTPGGSAIFSLQQGVTSKYMKKENGNAYVAEKVKDDLLVYGDDVETETDAEAGIVTDTTTADGTEAAE